VTSLKAFGAPFKLLPPYTILATQSLDYETSTSYSVEVTLTDDGSPPMSSSKNITIKVSEVFFCCWFFNKQITFLA